jgi:hypothetical protein
LLAAAVAPLAIAGLTDLKQARARALRSGGAAVCEHALHNYHESLESHSQPQLPKMHRILTCLGSFGGSPLARNFMREVLVSQ